MKKTLILMLSLFLFGVSTVYADQTITIGSSDVIVTDSDSSGDLSFGDSVKIGSDLFYVFKIDGDNAILFTKHTIDSVNYTQSASATKVSIPQGSYSAIRESYQKIADGYANYIKTTYGIEGTAAFLTASDFKAITGVNSQIDLDLKSMANVPAWFYEEDFLYADFTIIGGTAYAVRTIQNGIVVSEGTPTSFAGKVLLTIPKSSLDSLTIALGQIENGSADLSNSGNDITVDVTPDTGYELDEIKAIAGSYEYPVTNNTFTIDPSKGDVDVVVTFKKKILSINYDEVEGVEAEIGSNEAEYGSNREITIKAKDGYKLTSVKVNGVEMIDELDEDKLVLDNITEEMTIEVEVTKLNNDVIEPPKTFDPIMYSLVLGLISLIGIVLSSVVIKIK